MSQTVSQNHAYLIRRNEIYYFSRRVPSDLQTRFNKERVTISLRTRSFLKAEKSAEALSDRLERYWDGLRLEIFHTKELGLSLVASGNVERTDRAVSLDDAVANYLKLKSSGRSQTFFQATTRAVDLAASIAAGRAFQGLKTEKGDVVYIAGEGYRGPQAPLYCLGHISRC